MARMRPELSEARLDQLPSRAEARFYRACRDQLPNHVLVLHSVAVIRLTAGVAPQDAEADFVICDPDRGVLVVEVKGGGVSRDPVTGLWHSIDRYSQPHPIKDPFRQAMGGKHLMIEHLRAAPRWRQAGIGRVAIGHAVAFPDVRNVARLAGPHAPAAIIAGRDEVDEVSRWATDALNFWIGNDTKSTPPGSAGIDAIEEIFCPPLVVRPLLADVLEEEEAIRIRLTDQQARLLRALGRRPRAAIAGGAGTGKTLIAYRRACELAAAGRKTLLVCYNRALADFLKQQPERPPLLQPLSFHQLCEWRIGLARAASGRNLLAEAEADFPTGDPFDVLRPHALALACEILPDRFGAILVDEGQDFKAEYWLALQALLEDGADTVFYVFYDTNQALYTAVPTFPDLGPPFLLLANCRNTRPIHALAYQYYRGEATEPPDIDGAAIETITEPTLNGQARRLSEAVARLVGEEKVRPSDIVVLVPSRLKARRYELLERLPLPAGIRWAPEDHTTDGAVLLDTVARFKGLEAAIVFLWGLDDPSLPADRESLYVGLSRAKSRLVLVGESETAILER
jgi:hypothetical protein